MPKEIKIISDLEAAYKAIAADEVREFEATEWAEGLIGDVSDDEWNSE